MCERGAGAVASPFKSIKMNQIILESNKSSEIVPCVQMLTPVYNFTSERGLNASRTCVKHQLNSLRWTVRKHFKSLFRVHTVYCNTAVASNGPSTSGKENTETSTPIPAGTGASPAMGGRRYKLLEEEVEEFLQSETPMERLKRNFTPDEITGNYPGDIEMYRVGLYGLMFGCSAYGLLKGSRKGEEGFRRRNQFTMYISTKAANRRLRDRMAVEGMKELVRVNIKVLRFIIPVLCIDKVLTIYRNKSNPLHLATGFAVSLGLSNFMQGPKAFFSATVIGGSFGLAMGTFLCGMQYLQRGDQETMNRKMVSDIISVKRSYRRPEVLDTFPIDSTEDID